MTNPVWQTGIEQYLAGVGFYDPEPDPDPPTSGSPCSCSSKKQSSDRVMVPLDFVAYGVIITLLAVLTLVVIVKLK